ncbi:MAG: lysozyme inhibitor LprI family protein [Hyphomonadaceae bacterium]
MRAAIAALIFMGAAPGARADALEGFDAAALEICAAAVEAAGDEATVCVGVAARPCIEANGAATMSEALCWSEESVFWARRAEAAAQRLAARDPARAAALSSVGKAFGQFVDQECSYRGATFQGGSGAQPAMARCAAELWAVRAGMLTATERAY